jgi:hypothetical protein
MDGNLKTIKPLLKIMESKNNYQFKFNIEFAGKKTELLNFSA